MRKRTMKVEVEVGTFRFSFYADKDMTTGLELEIPADKVFDALRKSAAPLPVPNIAFVKGVHAFYFAPEERDRDKLKRHDAAVKANAMRKAKLESAQ